MTRRPWFSDFCDGRLSACCCVRLDFAPILIPARWELDMRGWIKLSGLLRHAKTRALFSNPNRNGGKPVECAISAVACVAPSLATRSRIRCDTRRGWKARSRNSGSQISGYIADDGSWFCTANNATLIIVGKSTYSRCLEILYGSVSELTCSRAHQVAPAGLPKLHKRVCHVSHIPSSSNAPVTFGRTFAIRSARQMSEESDQQAPTPRPSDVKQAYPKVAAPFR